MNKTSEFFSKISKKKKKKKISKREKKKKDINFFSRFESEKLRCLIIIIA